MPSAENVVPALTPPVKRKRVAIMQPYFFPYAGYFRLFVDVDVFVIYDCVQYSPGSRVGRSEVGSKGGQRQWLTLPLADQPLQTRICELRFAPDARARLDARMGKYPWLDTGIQPAATQIAAYLNSPLDDVVDFLERGLQLVTGILDLPATVIRSSTLDIPDALSGQDRVIAVARALGATDYINAAGGRHLYDEQAFRAHGIELAFLPEYRGEFFHLLPALLRESASRLRSDIIETCRNA